MPGVGTSTEGSMPAVLRVDPASPERDTMGLVEQALAEGRLVAYPTDTFYGLGANPCSVDAVEAIFRAKGRNADAPLPLIASDLRRLEAVIGPLSSVARRLAQAFWPGPLTLVVPLGRASLAPAVTAGSETVAVRVPAHLVARAVADVAGGLVTSTSANRSGEPPAATADAVVRALGRSLALVLDGGATTGEMASTIVDVTRDRPRLVRRGAVSFDRVLESLQ
jgi:L-threonylcarbamoyladenylate synthase